MGFKLKVVYAGFFLCLVSICEARRREYFIAMEEIEWKYDPSQEESKSEPLTKYKKAVYRQYTDGTFTVKSPRAPGLGLFGPIIRAEVKDTLIVHALNRASRSYSIHPHGVFYLKNSEGAMYSDNTANADKTDDAILPGDSHTYIWEVRDEYGPGPEDPNCLPWAYHSHVHSTKDQNSGLIGTLLTCRKGVLTSAGTRTDVDREYSVIAFVIDENESWYLEESIWNYAENPGNIDRKDPAFIKSNIKYSLNGKIWTKLSGLEMCEGDLVHWYMLGMGTQPHSLQFVGNTAVVNGHRLDTVSLMPATFLTAVMRADNPGTWMLDCHYANHTTSGMYVAYIIHDNCRPSVGAASSQGRENITRKVRNYYIMAEEMEWDYSPPKKNFLTKRPIDEDGQSSAKYFKQGPDRIGGTYIKALYKEYTDETFETKAKPNPLLGIMGPLIAAEVGETIEVIFKNNATQNYTIEPHGVFTEEIDEGVAPGISRKYIWQAPKSVSPTDKDKNCVPYLYSSFASSGPDQHTGLVGPMLICKKGTLDKQLQKGTHFILLTIYDENLSSYLQRNINKFTTDPSSVNTEDEDFEESNRMRTINGLSYGSYSGLEICAEEYTDLYVTAIGSDINTHSFLIDGAVVRHRTEYGVAVGVLPHSVATVTVRPYGPGSGSYGCHVTNHLTNGMFAFYQAIDCGNSGTEFKPLSMRKFYLGAVEELWDYLPNRTDHNGNSVDEPNHPAYLESRQEDGRFIGTKYKKAIYYEYTDETFTERKSKPSYFGFHGPLLKIEIGDEVEVVFKNMASIPYNAQTLGLFHMQGPVKPAQPGETLTYIWQARPEIAPTEDQPDCFTTSYVSFVDFYDINTGLRGPILICRRGKLELGKGGGADEEYYLLFSNVDENLSHYVDDNIRDFAKADPLTFDKKDKDFIKSNKINHINGFMYHLPDLVMKKGDLVRWHLYAEGEEVVHSVHFHANAIIHESDKENRKDVMDLQSGIYSTVIMRPDAVGEWLLHCHVNTDVDTGMVTTYRVLEETVVCKSQCYSYDCTATTNLDCSLLGITSQSDLLNGNSEVRVHNGKEVLFVSSDQVTYLDLSHNTDIGGTMELKMLLSKFPKLRQLKLDAVNLKELPKGFLEGHKMLSVLYLRRNKLESVDEEYVNGQGSLAVLDLRHNDLRQFSSDIFVGRRSRLKRLDLRGNPNLQPPCLNALHVDSRSFRLCNDSDVPLPMSGSNVA